MAIKLLTKSFAEHTTVDSTTVPTVYKMQWSDYYAGVGDLEDGSGNLITTYFYLPWIGDNFSIYYSTTYLQDLFLTDISMEPTDAIQYKWDTSDLELDKEVIVTYTWSTISAPVSEGGGSDQPRLNQASSWKVKYETILETQSLDSYVNSLGAKSLWAHKYYTELDPTIKMTFLNSEGQDEEKSYGSYTSQTGHSASGPPTSIQQKFIETTRDQIPEIQKRVPHTTCTVTGYSDQIKGQTLASYVGCVNSIDFIGDVYTKKELALIAKGKYPSYKANDWTNYDDSGKWMFIGWQMSDLGNGFLQYDFSFEYSPTNWNEYTDSSVGTIELKLYTEIDFYNTILYGMDYAEPNTRDYR